MNMFIFLQVDSNSLLSVNHKNIKNKLTFSLCMFFRVQFPVGLLALQLFLTTEKTLLKQKQSDSD